ncbi:MAG: FG-GAP repeat protein [Phycisphaerales bacterium]
MRGNRIGSGRIAWMGVMVIALVAAGRFASGHAGRGAEAGEVETLRGLREGIRFGVAVAVAASPDGWWIAVGDDGVEDGVAAEGAVEIFRREIGRHASSERVERFEGIAPRPFDRFGAAISMHGRALIVGAPDDDTFGSGAGRAEVHRLGESGAVDEAVLFDPDPSPADGFGGAVAIAGDLAVVGAMRADVAGLDSGRIVVFERIGLAWHPVASLAPPDAAAGDWFGHAVATDGERIAVGAYGDDDLGEKSGAVWVLSRGNGEWIFETKLVAPDGGPQKWFGFSLAIDGDRLLVGSPRDAPHGPSSGSVWTFSRDDAGWTPRNKVLARDGRPFDWFGYAIAMRGSDALVGAPGRDVTLADGTIVESAGDVVRCERGGERWRAVERLSSGSPRADRLAGSSVGIDGGLAVAGQLLAEDLHPSPGEISVFTRR